MGMFKDATKEETKRANSEDDLGRVSREVVLFYFQSWGQPVQRKVDALNAVVRMAGIKAEFVQKDEVTAGWKGKVEEAERAVAFRRDLDKCWPRGQFELEAVAVQDVILKHRREKG